MHHTLKLPAVPPWKKWNRDVLAREREVNPRMFARGFHMRAFSDDEKLFPHFRDCFVSGVVVAEVARRGFPVFVGVDLAGEHRPGNCICVLALDPATRKRFVLEVQYGGWKSPEVAARIGDVYARHPNLRFIMVENNGYQQSLIDWIHHTCADNGFRWKVEPFTTGKNKANPTYGLPSLEVEFKNKAWVIPQDEFISHPPICRCGWCHWTREVTDYPMAATSDGVMAMWFAREALDRWGGTGSAASGLGSDFNAR